MAAQRPQTSSIESLPFKVEHYREWRRRQIMRMAFTYLAPLIILIIYFQYRYVGLEEESHRVHLGAIAEHQANTLDLCGCNPPLRGGFILLGSYLWIRQTGNQATFSNSILWPMDVLVHRQYWLAHETYANHRNEVSEVLHVIFVGAGITRPAGFVWL